MNQLPVPSELAEVSSEIRLFRAVIDQALSDAVSRSNEKVDMAARHSALRWLDASNQDFLEVCEMAAVEPDLVFRALDYLRRNLHAR